MKPHLSPAGVPGLSRKRCALLQSSILLALGRSAEPMTASQVHQMVLNTVVNAETTRRLLLALVDEGRIRTRQAPGHTAVSAPLTVYELVYAEGGG